MQTTNKRFNNKINRIVLKGVHSFLFIARIWKMTIPIKIMPIPATSNCQPVEKNTNIQTIMPMIAGSGKSHILNGNFMSFFLYLKRITPMDWPTNWTSMRMTMMAVMTSFNLKKRLKINSVAPRINKDTWGKFLVGCSLAKIEKNLPSTAAE